VNELPQHAVLLMVADVLEEPSACYRDTKSTAKERGVVFRKTMEFTVSTDCKQEQFQTLAYETQVYVMAM
jgi:hypothetical protein